MKKEITSLYKYLGSKVGEIVDMNLDYFPDMIIATFVNHQDVLLSLEPKEDNFWTYIGELETRHKWALVPSKIDFTCHVRNCPKSEQPIAEKYLPIFAQPEKMQLASVHLA